MNYGYMMGASGVIAAMHRQDVAANNLANIQTVGYKSDASFTIPRQAARQEDGLMNMPSNALLERLGAGVLLAPNRINFSQGTILPSRNPFDVAIEGDGFLTVAGTGATPGTTETRLTRDGRMTLNPSGTLVTVADGRAVLDDGGRPITLNPAREFMVEGDGSISQGGSVVAKLGFTDVANRASLRKIGEGQFAPPSGTPLSRTTPTGRIVQYATEESGADPIKAMMEVQSAASLVGTTSKIMQIHNDLLNRAVNTLGRVTA